MEEIEAGSFANKSFPRLWPETVRVMSWNINRGLEFNGIVNFLEACSADLILLQEADINAHRTGRRNIPREIAQALQMNYVFGREFQELSQGSPTNPAYHGQATLSRLPLSNARLLRFRDQSTFWRPRWFVPPLQLAQRRVGGRMALICELTFGVGTILLYNLHLESRGSDELRIRQLSEVLDDMRLQPPEIPVLLAGDFNCDLAQERALSLIAGAGIDNPFAWPVGGRTVMKVTHGKAAAIDWMLTRGALSASRPAIHESITASDHFPLSLELHKQ